MRGTLIIYFLYGFGLNSMSAFNDSMNTGLMRYVAYGFCSGVSFFISDYFYTYY